MSSKRNRNGFNNNNNNNNNRSLAAKLPERERLELENKLSEFINSSETLFILPGLSNAQRKYLHKLAPTFGMKTRSYGNKNNRVLHLKRRVPVKILEDIRVLEVHEESHNLLTEIMPFIRTQIVQSASAPQKNLLYERSHFRGEVLGIGLGPRMVPPRPNRISNELFKEKQELPIFRYQDEIFKMLRKNSVFILNGETGSGKTTQVPQYILLDSMRRNRPCRVVVTQPRRVAATSVAHRVAEERGEQLGETVGYQIRMESRIRRTSNLIYTTSGFLLRSIMGNASDLYRKVSHLIIDEIHERDKNTDFILITVREHLKHNQDLKVILMSATMDVQLLSKYFNDCPILNVPGQGYDVKIYHLEDILYYTGYRTALMEKFLRSQSLEQNEPNLPNNMAVATHPVLLQDQYLQKFLDNAINKCCEDGRTDEEISEVFDQIHYYIVNEDMPVDACHSTLGLTPLMVACKCNFPQYIDIFLQLKANPGLRDKTGKSSIDYAAVHQDNVCLSQLQMNTTGKDKIEYTQVMCEKLRLLEAYQMQFRDEYDVDHDLILSLLEGLYRNRHPGAIMVFLPGYNDIVTQRDYITSTLPAGTFRICILHGQMDSQDQFEALQVQPVRKIILSTNIGQTSITIPDLAYIIDAGKIKMKTYDSITESSQLCSVWISQADAIQRSGRAGRTQNGVCYRLYSTDKFNHMPKYSPPEFMRTPLTEICLYAKTMEPNCDVKTYLSRALNPPSTFSVHNAIKKLQIMEVFNDDESVSLLGQHLVEMPLDVQLGKCLLYSIFLRCVDPALTIVAFHSVKDPYILPKERENQGKASFQRKQFAGESFSDHVGILELYKAYNAVRPNKKRCREFCSKNNLSQSAMEMFIATRRKIAEYISHKYNFDHITYCNDDWNLMRFCLAAGFYPNIAVIDRLRATISSNIEEQLVIQRTSALTPPGKKNLKDFIWQLPHDWIVYYEKSRIGRYCSINMNSVISPLIVSIQCGRKTTIECKEFDSELSDDSDEDGEEEEDFDDNDDGDDNDEGDDRNGEVGKSGNHEINGKLSLYDRTFIDDPNLMNIEKAFNDLNITTKKNSILTLDDWIRFELPAKDANMIWLLRIFIRNQFLDFLTNGITNHNSTASALLSNILSTFEKEEAQ